MLYNSPRKSEKYPSIGSKTRPEVRVGIDVLTHKNRLRLTGMYAVMKIINDNL